MTEKILPDTFYAKAFAAASWGGSTMCYAAEDRTGFQFYISSGALYTRLSDLERRGMEHRGVPIVVKRKRGLLGSKLEVFDELGTLMGSFYGPAGGGPDVSMEDVAAAYR